MKRHVESFWRSQLWLRRVCYGLLLLAAAAMIALMSFQPPDQVAAPSHSLPTDMIPGGLWQQNGTQEFHILDVLSFGSEVLVLIRVTQGFQFPSKERLQCRYGSTLPAQQVLALHFMEPHLAAVVCNAPPSKPWNQISISINRETQTSMTMMIPWNSTRVVYDAYSTQHDVALFVHGFNQTLGYELSRFQCVYGDQTPTSSVTAQAYEIFRCGRPLKSKIQTVTLRFDGKLLPSVAYYKPPPQRHHICACTMIYNGAKFLREWVYYHSHLGVEKFIIYDNNSDDNLDEEISNLARFNVTKHSWPWVKTQEAALSHCALAAEPECTWMLFTDIDEYFFPSERFLEARNVSILAGFINEILTKDAHVGQIATYCRNFGPSGLSVSPRAGVTQGYTCRLQRQRRHKSIVLLSAIADSLANQVHHFTLKPPYVMAQIRPWVAIINHYKFQVWDEFKTKFHRRAATYVADWTEDRNHGSNDRVSGLGTKPVKPADWESRYCEVQDYGLRDYTRRIFGTSQGDGHELRLAWEGSGCRLRTSDSQDSEMQMPFWRCLYIQLVSLWMNYHSSAMEFCAVFSKSCPSKNRLRLVMVFDGLSFYGWWVFQTSPEEFVYWYNSMEESWLFCTGRGRREASICKSILNVLGTGPANSSSQGVHKKFDPTITLQLPLYLRVRYCSSRSTYESAIAAPALLTSPLLQLPLSAYFQALQGVSILTLSEVKRP